MEILTKLQSEMLAILPEYEKLTSNKMKEEKKPASGTLLCVQ